jgi:phospholipid transport system substrate-binding protein
MTSARRGLAFAAALALLLASAEARAGQPTEQLRTQIDRVIKVLEDPELKKDTRLKERRAAVRKIANDIFDFGETAKRSLARHWPPRTPAEREEFIALFADLLERSYISKIELYGGEKIGYIGETVESDLATVRTKLVTRQQTEIPVDYRMMLKRGNRWLVYDVIIEGVSLIANYRVQFNKIITTSSYQELVKRMKAKQEEFYEDERAKRTSRR